MRRALLLVLVGLLVAPIALGAPPPRKAGAEPAAAPAAPVAVAAAPPPSPSPPPALPAAPSASTPQAPRCCASLAQAGFKISPGMPVIVLTTTKPLESRTKAPVEICTCSSGSGDSASSPPSSEEDLQVPGLARVRGGVNTQRYNSIKQFAIYPDLWKKKETKETKREEKTRGKGGSSNGTTTSPATVAAAEGAVAETAAPSSSHHHSSFVGLPRGKQFVLIGQVNDTFSLKYWTGLELARKMGAAAGRAPSDALVVPRARQVELFVVDEGRPLAFGGADQTSPSQHYRGVYLLTQHIDPALIPGMEGKKAKKEKKNSSGGNETLSAATAAAESQLSSGGKLSPGSFVSTFLHGERIDPDFSAYVEMPITNRWAGKNKEWAVKYPNTKDVQKMANEQGRALVASISKRYAAVEDAVFAGGKLSPADFDSPEKVARMVSSSSSNATTATAPSPFEKAAHLPSWLDWFLLAEFTKVTKHSYHSAAFMHSLGDSEDPRLRFGPAWSYGQGMGTCCGYPVQGFLNNSSSSSSSSSAAAGGGFNGFSGGGGTTPNGFLFTLCLVDGRCPSLDGYDRGNGFSPWFVALFFGPPALSSSSGSSSSSSSFARAAAERWSELRRGPWSDASLREMMAGRAALLSSGPGERALARWPALAAEASKAVEAAAAAGGEKKDGTTPSPAAAVPAAIERWLLERARWLDGAFAQAGEAATRGRAYPVSYSVA